MDCCCVTFKDILDKVNQGRTAKKLPAFTYHQAWLVWGRVSKKREDIKPIGKIGVSYVFSRSVAKKIIKNMIAANYNFKPGFDPWKINAENKRLKELLIHTSADRAEEIIKMFKDRKTA